MHNGHRGPIQVLQLQPLDMISNVEEFNSGLDYVIIIRGAIPIDISSWNNSLQA